MAKWEKFHLRCETQRVETWWWAGTRVAPAWLVHRRQENNFSNFHLSIVDNCWQLWTIRWKPSSQNFFNGFPASIWENHIFLGNHLVTHLLILSLLHFPKTISTSFPLFHLRTNWEKQWSGSQGPLVFTNIQCSPACHDPTIPLCKQTKHPPRQQSTTPWPTLKKATKRT